MNSDTPLHKLHTFFGLLYAQVRDYATRDDLWQVDAKRIAACFKATPASWEEALTTVHEAQRLITLQHAHLGHNPDFKQALAEVETPLWRDFHEPPADRSLQDALADRLYFHPPGPDAHDRAAFIMGSEARYIGARLITKAIEDAIDFTFDIADPNFDRLVLRHMDAAHIPDLGEWKKSLFHGVSKRISATVITPREELIDHPAEKSRLLAEEMQEVSEQIRSGAIDFALTKIPTPADAEIDGFEYEDYIGLFFELCDQPWDYIDRAHQKLIAKLDAGRDLHFTNDKGTDLHMELMDEKGRPFTFCNSLVARNIPGSEVFSAPRKDSVNGTIMAPGWFNYSAGKYIRDLTLHFKDGYLYDYHAEEGGVHFQDFLDRHPGNRYVGEIGIGTNPHLRHHVLNGLLVEKISGSFHVALGSCYTMTEYQGARVYVDNGNTATPDHWDITTMLRRYRGDIELDGEKIMKDGRFTDPGLDVLNDGWAAVPAQDRPGYWKDFTGYTD